MPANRNPFVYDRDSGPSQATEFSFGKGRFPDPGIDFSDCGTKSGIPLAHPTRLEQGRDLAAIRRMDINDPDATPSVYVLGNTDRYGAQPPLVRERRAPAAPPRVRYARPKMERGW